MPLSRTDELKIGEVIHVTVTISGAEASGGQLRYSSWRSYVCRLSNVGTSKTELEGWITISENLSLWEWKVTEVTVTCEDGSVILLGENSKPLENLGFMVSDSVAPAIIDVRITAEDGTPLSRTDEVEIGDKVHVTVTISGAEASGGQLRYSSWRSYVCRLSSVGTSKTELEGWITISENLSPWEWKVETVTVTCEDGSEISLGANDKLLETPGFTVKDPAAPVITDVRITAEDGTPLSRTDEVEIGDEIHVTVTISGAEVSGGKITFSGWRAVTNRLSNVMSSKTELEGYIPIEGDIRPGEWTVAKITVTCEDGSEISFGANNKLLQNLGFTVLDTAKEDTAIPEYSVTLYSLSGDGELMSETVSVPRGTGLAELNSKYQPEDNSNLNFKGWQSESAEQAAAVNNYGIFTDGYTFFAEYDKKLVTFNLCTRDVSGIISGQYTTVRKVYAKPGETIKLPTEIEGYEDIIWYNPKTDSAYSDSRITVTTYTDPSPVMTISGSAVCVGDDKYPTDPDSDQGDDSDTSSPDQEWGDSSDTWSSGYAQDSTDGSQTASSGITGRRRNTGNTPASQEVSEAADDFDVSSDMEEETIIDEWTAGIVAQILQAAAGDTVIVDMESETIVSKEILEAAQGRDVNIILRMNGYTWTINGKNILSPTLKDVDLMIILDTTNIPEATLTELAGDNPVRQVTLVHEGNFGFSATLTINIGSEYASRRGQLYYHDSSGRMMFIDAGDIGEDGNVSLTFSHASDYAIVIHESFVAVPDDETVSTEAGAVFAIQVACVCGIAACIYMIKKEKNRAKEGRRAERSAA